MSASNKRRGPPQRRSAIVDFLARSAKPITTGAIADALGVDLAVMCTRVRQLEETGRIKGVGTATRTRDIRWTLVDPADMRGIPRVISFGGDQVLDAMQKVCLQRLSAGGALTVVSQ